MARGLIVIIILAKNGVPMRTISIEPYSLSSDPYEWIRYTPRILETPDKYRRKVEVVKNSWLGMVMPGPMRDRARET